ncbi:unnamed protein product [Closterium sp. NIES-53]
MARTSSSGSIAERSLEVELLLVSLGAPPSFALRHRRELHSRKLACDSDGVSDSRDIGPGERPLAALASVVALISAGKYAAALERASSALPILPSAEQLAEALPADARIKPGEAAAGAAAAEAFFRAVRGRIGALLADLGGKTPSGSGNAEEEEWVGEWSAGETALSVLMMGAASLCLFVQANVSGPEPSAVPTLPLSPPHPDNDTSAAVQDTSATPTDTSASASQPSFLASETARVALSKWCQVELMTDGADVTGRCHLPQYLLLARTLLLPPLFPLLFPSPSYSSSSPSPSSSSLSVKPSEAFSPSLLPPSWPWWASRVVVIHQRMLQERSPSLRALLLPCTAHLGEKLGRKDAVKRAFFRKDEEEEEEAEGGEKEGGKEGEGEGEVCVRVAALVHLEVGMMEMAYAHVDTARCVPDTWTLQVVPLTHELCLPDVQFCITPHVTHPHLSYLFSPRIPRSTSPLLVPPFSPGPQQTPALVGRKWFERALQECGVVLSVTGAMGYRTIHQVDPKAQLVLAVSRSEAGKQGDALVLRDLDWQGSEEAAKDGKGEEGEGKGGKDGEQEEEEGESMEELECLFEPESDVLLAPRLVEGGGGGGGSEGEKQSGSVVAADHGGSSSGGTSGGGGGGGVLRGVEQAAVLAMAVDTVKQNAADELRGDSAETRGKGDERWRVGLVGGAVTS